MRSIHIVSEADLDLLSIDAYLQSKSPEAGAKFIPAVERTLEQLAENPELGGRCATRRLTLKGLRV